MLEPTEIVIHRLLIRALLSLYVASDMSPEEATMRTVVSIMRETKGDKQLVNTVIELMKELSQAMQAETEGLAVSVMDKPDYDPPLDWVS